MTELEPTLPVHINRLATWFTQGVQMNMARLGYVPLTKAQGIVVSNIAAGEKRMARIAENLGVTAQAISQIIAEMESRHIIVSSIDSSDRRARIVEFTPEFEQYNIVARQVIRGLESKLEEQFGKPVIDVMRMVVRGDWGEPPAIHVPPHPVPERFTLAFVEAGAKKSSPGRRGKPTARMQKAEP